MPKSVPHPCSQYQPEVVCALEILCELCVYNMQKQFKIFFYQFHVHVLTL